MNYLGKRESIENCNKSRLEVRLRKNFYWFSLFQLSRNWKEKLQVGGGKTQQGASKLPFQDYFRHWVQMRGEGALLVERPRGPEGGDGKGAQSPQEREKKKREKGAKIVSDSYKCKLGHKEIAGAMLLCIGYCGKKKGTGKIQKKGREGDGRCPQVISSSNAGEWETTLRKFGEKKTAN